MLRDRSLRSVALSAHRLGLAESITAGTGGHARGGVARIHGHLPVVAVARRAVRLLRLHLGITLLGLITDVHATLRRDLAAVTGSLLARVGTGAALALATGATLAAAAAEVEHRPVEHGVELEALAEEELLEETLEVGVVGLVVEAQRAAVLEVGAELGGVALAEYLDGGVHLLLHNLLVLLLLGVGLESLPRQAAADEVHVHVAQGLEVVTTALLNAHVRVDGGVTRRAREVLVLTVGDVLVRLGVAVLLGQTEVDDVHDLGPLAQADEEVVRLDVAVDEVLRVAVLEAAQQLVGDHQHGLELEAAAAVVEQVLERRAEQVDDHHVLVAAPQPTARSKLTSAVEDLVDLGLVEQLRVLALDGLELDADLLARRHVRAQVDVAERAAADLAAQAELLADSQLQRALTGVGHPSA
ncbi:hypothetical protein ON010_g1609 [Phytophthora cinnamomi]|nr:hypothetical protein ON010_g1609 [Phytophthora cinnamomi]